MAGDRKGDVRMGVEVKVRVMWGQEPRNAGSL